MRFLPSVEVPHLKPACLRFPVGAVTASEALWVLGYHQKDFSLLHFARNYHLFARVAATYADVVGFMLFAGDKSTVRFGFI